MASKVATKILTLPFFLVSSRVIQIIRDTSGGGVSTMSPNGT